MRSWGRLLGYPSVIILDQGTELPPSHFSIIARFARFSTRGWSLHALCDSVVLGHADPLLKALAICVRRLSSAAWNSFIRSIASLGPVTAISQSFLVSVVGKWFVLGPLQPISAARCSRLPASVGPPLAPPAPRYARSCVG